MDNGKKAHVHGFKDLVLLNSYQNPIGLFCRNRKIDLKFIWRYKRFIAKTILKKNKAGEFTLPDYRILL
jgi:hypothetical protein